MKRSAFILFAILMIIGSSVSAFGQKRLVADTEWRLTEAEGKALVRSGPTISFNAAGTHFGGSTGCNSMTGTVEIRGKKILFGTINTTERMCKLMAGSVAENVVLDGLRNARKFDVRGKVLTLFDAKGRVTLRFARDGKADNSTVKLEDRKWVLEQIKDRQTFAALPYAFVNFDAKKHSAGGNTSCNVFGGNYVAKGSSITFSDIIATMRACVEDDSKMSTEREMMEGLRSANRYEIRDERLMLYRGVEVLLTFRGEDK